MTILLPLMVPRCTLNYVLFRAGTEFLSVYLSQQGLGGHQQVPQQEEHIRTGQVDKGEDEKDLA